MILWWLPISFVWTFLFVMGAVIGSFLNVCIYRLPQHEGVWDAWNSLGNPPSSCPFCRRRIWKIDNVPILGWLWLWGRCRFCRHKISGRYPGIEFLNGVLFLGLYMLLVPAEVGSTIADSCIYSPMCPIRVDWYFTEQSAALHLTYLYYLVLVEALLVASFIDFDLQIIPDSVTLPAMAVGLAGSLIGTVYLLPVWFQNPSLLAVFWDLFVSHGPLPEWLQFDVPTWIKALPRLHGLAVSVAGLLIGGGVIWYVRIVGEWVFRREAMGFGDVILMAMIGSFLGWQPTLMVFVLAPLCALTVVCLTGLWSLLRRSSDGPAPREIPFGPYLSLGALLVIVGWNRLYDIAERFFSLGPFFVVLAVVLMILLVVVLWLMQGLKAMLGLATDVDESGEWTSADQLTFFASKDPENGLRGLARSSWPGAAAGQGSSQRNRWLGR